MSSLVSGNSSCKWQPLTIAVANGTTEKVIKEVGVDVRMCKNCRNTVFSRRDFIAALKERPSDQRAYENMIQFERGIRLMLPKFQRLLVALQYVNCRLRTIVI